MSHIKSFAYRIFGLLWISLCFSSCLATKTYKTPEIEETQYAFRLDSLAQKTASTGRIAWQKFFKDPLLIEHINLALTHNKDHQIALKNMAIFKAQYLQGKAGHIPTLQLNASTQKIKTGLPFPQNITQYQADATLAWEADLWGRINSQKLATKAAFKSSETAKQLLQTQIIANVASTYYKLMEADQRKVLLTTTVTLRSESVKTLESLKQAGQANSLAVQQATSQLMQAKTLLNSVNNNIFTLENALMSLVGRSYNTIKRGAIDTQTIAGSFASGVPLDILANRLDVKEAELQVLTTFENHNVARAAMYPTLRLSANFGTQGLEPSTLFKNGSFFHTLIGGLTAPILNGRQLRTRKDVSQLQLEQRVLQFQQTVLDASIEVSNVFKQHEINAQNLAILKTQENLLEQSFNDAKALLNAGMANYLDVLNAQDALLNVQIQHLNTQLSVLETSAVLYRALGGGTY